MSSAAVISLPEHLVSATEHLRKCSGAVTKVFRNIYESVPGQLISVPEQFISVPEHLRIGVRDVCNAIGLCVFGTHLTDDLTVSVSMWRLALLITVCDLQLVGMPSFTGYFTKMASIKLISINGSRKVPPIYNREYKLIFVMTDLT